MLLNEEETGKIIKASINVKRLSLNVVTRIGFC